ncbi:hypothetical protein GEMRC1_002041 [Eukaryota sp. GEM-RC1]
MRIHLKNFDDDFAFFEIPASSSCEELANICSSFINLTITLKHTVELLNQFSQHGVQRPESEFQLDEEVLSTADIASLKAVTSFEYCPDPSGQRCGHGLLPHHKSLLQDQLDEIHSFVGESAVKSRHRQTISQLVSFLYQLRDLLHHLTEDIGGIPDCDPLFDLYSLPNDLTDYSIYPSLSGQYKKPDSISLWWAGKKFDERKSISDYAGRNDKTKILVKVTGKGSGAPPSEKAIDGETEKKLMAYYYRKQEEMKSLKDFDSFDNSSSWADPNALRSSLTGIGNVNWR